MRKKEEPVTIRLEVKRGKEVLFSSVVEHDTGLCWEFPKSIPLLESELELTKIVVAVYTSVNQEVKMEREARQARLAAGGSRRGTVSRISDFFGGKKETPDGHIHETKASSIRPYEGCVAPENCEERAHDDQTFLERCSCGAMRLMNARGNFVEKGDWS